MEGNKGLFEAPESPRVHILAVCLEQNPNFLPNESRRMKPARRRSLPLAAPQKNTLYSFHFARAGFSFSPNEKSIFLWCFALTSKAAGLASIFCKGMAEFPPHPPSAMPLLGRTEFLATDLKNIRNNQPTQRVIFICS